MTRTGVVLLVAAMAAAAGCGEDEPDARSPEVARAVPTSVCSPIAYGGEGRPRFVVPLVAPLQNAFGDHGVQNTQAIKQVLQERGWRAGEHRVGIQVCDEANAEEYVDLDKCERNAQAFAGNPSVVAVIGPTLSSCAGAMLPVLNRAKDGPLVLAGTGTTYLGLTREGPGVEDGDPGEKYPSGRRSFVRTVPADDAQAAAAAMLLRDAGVRRPFALHDGDAFGEGAASAFNEAAERAGLRPAGIARWDGAAGGYAKLARRVARSGADGVYLGGYVTSNGPRLVRDLRDELGEDAEIAAPDGFNQATTLVEGAGDRADGLAITLAAAPARALPPPGRRWAERFERRWGAVPCCYAVHTGQTMELVLDAIARSDGSRRDVLDRVRRTEVRGGLVGDFRFDEHGDTTLTTIGVFRIRGGRLRFERTIDVPRELLTRR